MNTNDERYFDVVNGPNKDALFDACKYACGKGGKVDVNFDVAIAYTMPKNDPGCAYVPMAITDFRIIGIEHEDGSGVSFNLHGYCKADLYSFFGKDGATYKPYRFKMYYNSKSREGSIAFEEQ